MFTGVGGEFLHLRKSTKGILVSPALIWRCFCWHQSRNTCQFSVLHVVPIGEESDNYSHHINFEGCGWVGYWTGNAVDVQSGCEVNVEGLLMVSAAAGRTGQREGQMTDQIYWRKSSDQSLTFSPPQTGVGILAARDGFKLRLQWGCSAPTAPPSSSCSCFFPSLILLLSSFCVSFSFLKLLFVSWPKDPFFSLRWDLMSGVIQGLLLAKHWTVLVGTAFSTQKFM